MLVFGLLRPSSFFSATNLNAILVSQSVTAILALAVMVPLATKQFDLSVGYHLGMAQVLIVGLQVTTGIAVARGGRADLARILAGGLRQRPSRDLFPHRFLYRHHGHRNAALRGDQLVHERRTDCRNELAGQFHGAHSDRPRRSPSGRLRRDHCGGAVDRHGALAGWPKPLCHRRQCSRRRTHRHQRSASRDGRVHRRGAA